MFCYLLSLRSRTYFPIGKIHSFVVRNSIVMVAVCVCVCSVLNGTKRRGGRERQWIANHNTVNVVHTRNNSWEPYIWS